MAKEFVDRAYRNNEKTLVFYERMIIVHVILAVAFLIVSIVVDKAFYWVEAYALPALSYFIYAHRSTNLNNSSILARSNESIEKANNQEIIRGNFRIERAMRRR